MKALVVAVVLTLPVDAALGFQSDTPVVQATSLTEDQLRQAIVGKTVYLNVSGFELPIRYKANGRMTGNMGVVAASFSQGDGSRDSGGWRIDANQLCQRWTSWMDGQIHCYKISRQGTVINWLREDGVSGTARVKDCSFLGLAATYPPPSMAQDAAIGVTNVGTADGVWPWTNCRRRAAPSLSRMKSLLPSAYKTQCPQWASITAI
jgi:hypothetical protein